MKYLAFLVVFLAIPCCAQDHKPIRKEKAWIALTGLSAASSLSDAIATMRNRDRGDHLIATYGTYGCGPTAQQYCGFTEHNPIERPFTSLPKPAYYSWKLGESALSSYVGLRMKRSHRWYRHIWWLPQTVNVASGIVGAVYNTAHGG
jgi:hypothetical protein